MVWEVWFQVTKDHSRRYCGADSKAHAQRLAKYHTSISIHPYFAKEIEEPAQWSECDKCGHQWKNAGITSSACPVCGHETWTNIDPPVYPIIGHKTMGHKEVKDAPSVPATTRRGQEAEAARDAAAAQSIGNREYLVLPVPQRDGMGDVDVAEPRNEGIGATRTLPSEDDAESVLVIDMQSRPNPKDARSASDESDEDTRTEEEKINEGHYTYARPKDWQPFPQSGHDLNSRDAYERVRGRITQDMERVYAFFCGRTDATFDEAEAVLGILHQSMGRIALDLREIGWVKRTGERRVTRSGSMAWIYEAVPQDRAVFTQRRESHRDRATRYERALEEINIVANGIGSPIHGSVIEDIRVLVDDALNGEQEDVTKEG